MATLVAEKHPREATVERAVLARGRRAYIDYLQHIKGKTLASALRTTRGANLRDVTGCWALVISRWSFVQP